MKIALVANTAFNILNFRLGLIVFLESKGYDVVYIAPYDDAVEKIAKISHVRFIPLHSLSRKGYNPMDDFLLARELYTIYKKEQIHIALSYTIKPNIYSGIAGYFSKTKTICNLTGLGFVFMKKSMANTIAKNLYKLSLSLCNIIVFQNNTDKQFCEQNGIAQASKTVLINGSGINTDIYIPSQTHDQKETFVLLFVGRLLFDKGIQEFVAAANRMASQYANVRFHLLGGLDEGNPSAVSQAQLDEWLQANPALQYLGNQADVKPFINDCDAVVLPSYREGIPRVLLEAMALQKPFITVNSPGCEDVTHHDKNGLLAQVKSVDSLYDCMLTMYLKSKEERKEMGLYGRKLILEKYDEKIIVAAYLKLILSLS